MNTKIVDGRLEAKMNFSSRCVDCYRKVLTQIADVKEQVVAEFRDQLDGHKHVLDLALNEAEALAWETGFPQLLFPTLATEKANAVTGWHRRQQHLRQRTAPLHQVA